MTGFFAHLLPHTPQLKPPVYFFLESSFGHWANSTAGGGRDVISHIRVQRRRRSYSTRSLLHMIFQELGLGLTTIPFCHLLIWLTEFPSIMVRLK
jgi:hypothetical protein